MSINDSFVTSIVSGSLTFFVSGRRSVKIPATRAVEPNIKTGACGFTSA